MQTATRATLQAGGDLIRKMRPFEEPHAFAFILVKQGYRGLFSDFSAEV
jgi:hypothetical protein